MVAWARSPGYRTGTKNLAADGVRKGRRWCESMCAPSVPRRNFKAHMGLSTVRPKHIRPRITCLGRMQASLSRNKMLDFWSRRRALRPGPARTVGAFLQHLSLQRWRRKETYQHVYSGDSITQTLARSRVRNARSALCVVSVAAFDPSAWVLGWGSPAEAGAPPAPTSPPKSLEAFCTQRKRAPTLVSRSSRAI